MKHFFMISVILMSILLVFCVKFGFFQLLPLTITLLLTMCGVIKYLQYNYTMLHTIIYNHPLCMKNINHEIIILSMCLVLTGVVIPTWSILCAVLIIVTVMLCITPMWSITAYFYLKGYNIYEVTNVNSITNIIITKKIYNDVNELNNVTLYQYNSLILIE